MCGICIGHLDELLVVDFATKLVLVHSFATTIIALPDHSSPPPSFHNHQPHAVSTHRAREVVVHDVKYATFLLVLHYLYTDEVQIQVDNAMDLFQVRACLPTAAF